MMPIFRSERLNLDVRSKPIQAYQRDENYIIYENSTVEECKTTQCQDLLVKDYQHLLGEKFSLLIWPDPEAQIKCTDFTAHVFLSSFNNEPNLDYL